ncbi:RNA methyltransferase [Patescibacteria group bacterium]|nr:RNA methyltransferase [Patescibacteria group bacterium]MBU1906773.1 RNA methyltransferase [Patescibacteria group bacterium]
MNINEITSKDNQMIKELKRLSQKKYRDKLGKFVVENWKIIIDARVAPESLFVTEQFLADHQAEIEELGIDVNQIDEKLNKFFSCLDTPSGVAAMFPKLDQPIQTNQITIYLNAISDPGNLGTILRSALAFDLTNIVVDETCADVYNPKTIQAAKDAIFQLNISFDEHRQILRDLKEQMPIVATTLEAAEPIESLKRLNKYCLVLGSESHGVDPEIIKIADHKIKIEMGEQIESLNVAAAAAIIFHEIYRS